MEIKQINTKLSQKDRNQSMGKSQKNWTMAYTSRHIVLQTKKQVLGRGTAQPLELLQ